MKDEVRGLWSFRPLSPVEPPPVKDEAWCRTPVDRFVLAKLEERALSPNPPADRRTFIRRASLDLIGLPPEPGEVEAFVEDPAADAPGRLIDRLLGSAHHGERWGRHWLDLARFAESHGYEHDYDRPTAYHFRDFVIRALNEDMPYDRFVRLQIAGDELEPENPLALMATGFLGAGTHSTQITANLVEKERYDEMDDMASTIGTSMLGMTIGCARCHDHKYDPIPQKDYYRLISTFTTTVRSEIDLDLHPERYWKAKAEFDREHAPLVEALERFEKEELPARLDGWLSSGAPAPELRWMVLDDLASAKSEGATFGKLEDGSLLASGANPANDTYVFVANTTLTGITAVRIEALAHPSMPKGGPGRAENGNFALSGLSLTAAPLGGRDPAVPVKLTEARATFEQKGLPVKAVIDGDKKTGWAVDPQFGKDHAAVFETESPVGFPGGTVLTLTLKFEVNGGHNIGRPRLAVTAAPRPAPLDGDHGLHSLVIPARRVLALSPEGRSNEDRAALLKWYRTIDPRWLEIQGQVAEHRKREPRPELKKVLISSEGLPPVRLHTQGADFFEKTYFLKRGDPNQKEGEATQGFLQVLVGSPEAEKRWQAQPPAGWRTSYRRTALARWITDVEGGAGRLLARVIVNRLWQHHLGRGIVATPSDFGTQGERPTHAELLDWLALELVKGGWRLKPIHKLIMSSAIYMQSVAFDPARVALDPENRLLWRRSRRRLEGEVIRDSMLAVSGLLDRTQLGPGTLDEGQRRRSIYFTVKRSQLIPMMALFDAPDALQSMGQRSSTTVPPQALLLMNNVQVLSYARAFAGKIAPKAGVPLEEAVRSGYRSALGRPPLEEEERDALEFLEGQVESYRGAGKSDARELALADFCMTLFSLNEFFYLE